MAKITANQRLDTSRILNLLAQSDDASRAPDAADPMHKYYIYPGGNKVLTMRGHDFEYDPEDSYIVDGVINSIEIGHNPSGASYVVDYKFQGLQYDIQNPSQMGIDLEGPDTIIGSRFGDRIAGFDGSDKLTGGAGSDTFYFTTTPNATNVDRITDFSHGRDKIALDTDLFHGITRANLGASFHDITSSAEQRDDHILYNHRTGWLSYDADGAGGHKPVHFATIDNHAQLTSGNFILI